MNNNNRSLYAEQKINLTWPNRKQFAWVLIGHKLLNDYKHPSNFFPTFMDTLQNLFGNIIFCSILQFLVDWSIYIKFAAVFF